MGPNSQRYTVDGMVVAHIVGCSFCERSIANQGGDVSTEVDNSTDRDTTNPCSPLLV